MNNINHTPTAAFDSLTSPTNTLNPDYDVDSNSSGHNNSVLHIPTSNNISIDNNISTPTPTTTILTSSRTSSGSSSGSSTDDDFDRVNLLKDVSKANYYADVQNLPTTPTFFEKSSTAMLYPYHTNSSSTSVTSRIHHFLSVLLYSIKSYAKIFLRICKGRLIINSNITVPLWLVFALITLFWAGVIVTIVLLATGSISNVGILPSVSGLPPVREINGKIDRPFVLGCTEPQTDEPRANAVLVVLARNKEYPGVISSMQSLERHFNRWFHYPYVFLNDEPFNSTFKEAVKNVTDSEVEFGTIDTTAWNFPSWADVDDVEEAIALQGDRAIMYGGMASYHRMCRFYSGAFFQHPLLQKYEWYWRVEPDVKYFCDITYDPFKFMEKTNKVYGFTIVIKELVETVPNLFRHTYGFKQSRNITSKGMWELFLKKHRTEAVGDPMSNSGSVQKSKLKEHMDNLKKDKEALAKLQEELPDEAMIGDPSARKFMPAGKELESFDDDDQKLDIDNYDYFAHDVPQYSINGETYNMCHFWSNFEIARLDFFRSKEYQDYFETLDKSGGFWEERWGDAPVHSLAAGLFLSPEQVHYFRDIGYRHTTIQHCPANAPERQLPHVPYIRDPTDRQQIEEDDYWANYDPEVTNGVGCRCRCDTDVVEVEGKDGSCLGDWVDLIGGWV